jgi:hypothetical protein
MQATSHFGLFELATVPATPVIAHLLRDGAKDMRSAAILFALLMTMGLSGFASAQAPSPAAQGAPVIYRIEPNAPRAGDTITIVGRGFASRNTVVFGRTSLHDVLVAWAAGITCVPGNTDCHPGVNQGLILTVPANATARHYEVSVETGNGVSNRVTVAVIAAPARLR